MSQEEYDLVKSKSIVGPLYPVLLSKDGKVIDGIHRSQADPAWPVMKTEIDSKDTEKFLLARAHANLGRRTIPETEKDEIVNGLAEQYALRGETCDSLLTTQNQLLQKLVSVLDGCMSERTILRHLDSKYKQTPTSHREPKPVLQALRDSEFIKKRYGEDAIPKIEAEIKQQAREEFKKDPVFVAEVIEQAPRIFREMPKPVIDNQGYHVPTVVQHQKEQMTESQKRVEERFEARRQDPKVLERAKWVKAWMALTNIANLQESLFCPVCGSTSESLVWKCHPDVNLRETHRRVKERVGAS